MIWTFYSYGGDDTSLLSFSGIVCITVFTVNVLETALKAAALPREKFCSSTVHWRCRLAHRLYPAGFFYSMVYRKKRKQSRRQINRITTKIESRITFKVFLITVAVALLFNAQLKRKSYTNGNCCCPCLFNFRRFTGLPTKYEMVFPPRIEQLSLVVV